VKVDIKAALLKAHDEKVSGSVYVRTYDYRVTKSGAPFVFGYVNDQGCSISFRVWRENIEDFRSLIVASRIMAVSGVIDIWNNIPSIVFESVKADSFGYTPADFLLGYDRGKLEGEFYGFLENVNPKVRLLVNKLIDGDVKERFFTEYAAKLFHDACVGGLANHTVKMLRLAKTMVDNDKRLLPFSDLIYMGIICHDIGKVREFYMGDYVKNSFVSHSEYGCEMLYEIKEYIVNLFDEAFFYRLLSVIRGHHHIFEVKAKTIYAYIVHLIDMLDSQATMFMDNLDSHAYKETANGEKTTDHFDEIYYY
jgi:3'-5' exoribonuclease